MTDSELVSLTPGFFSLFTHFLRIDWESSKLRFILGSINTKHFQSSSVNKGKGGPGESQIDIRVCISRSVG